MRLTTPLFELEGEGSGGGGGAVTATAPPAAPVTVLGGTPPPAGSTPPLSTTPQAALKESDWLVEGKFASGFSQRLPDDLKEHAATMSKFEGVPLKDVLKSYGALQQKLGKRVQAPSPDAKPEEIAEWRKITGAPEKPEGYNITKPADMPDQYWNPELADGFAQMAHKHHLSPAAAQDLVSWWNGQQKAAIEKTQGYMNDFKVQSELSLQKDWGDKFQDNVHAAKRVAMISGLDVNDPDIGDNPTIIRALHAMSNLISDDRQVSGKGGAPSMSGMQEADDIQRNPANPWYNDYHNKNGTERQKQAQDRVLKLRMAASV